MDQSGVGQDLGLMETQDGQETEVLTSLALLMSGDTDGTLRQAQVAVHIKPQVVPILSLLPFTLTYQLSPFQYLTMTRFLHKYSHIPS